MWKRDIFEGITLTRSRFLAILLLLVNAMTWSYMTAILIGVLLRTVDMRFMGYAVYYISAVIFALVGGFLAKKVLRLQILRAWTALGVATSCLPILLRDSSSIHLLALCVIWGALVGVGLPSCLSLLSSLTKTEERGRISGMILFATYGVLFPAVFLIYNVGAVAGSALLAVWRLLGLVMLRYDGWSSPVLVERRLISYPSVLRNRSFILYFVPWLTFMLVDTTEQAVLVRFFGSDLYDLITLSELAVGAVSALIGGFLLDFFGRKRTVILGFVILGLGYAVLGLTASMPASWLVFAVADGMALGPLTTMFMFTVWGDFSPEEHEEYYAIGILPPFLGGIVRGVFAPILEPIPISGAFSLASFFLFLAVVPLLMAPETLPDRVMERRRVRDYIERAKKIAKGHVS